MRKPAFALYHCRWHGNCKEKGSLSEDHGSEAKSGVIRSAVRVRASVPVRAHVSPVTAGGRWWWGGGGGGCCWVEQVGEKRSTANVEK